MPGRADGFTPVSISKAIGFLEDQRLIRRERDGRRERYVVHDDMWYRASIATAASNVVLAEAALDGAEILGPDTPAGARLAETGRFIKVFTEDLLSRAEHWHAVATGGHPSEPEPPAT